MKLLIDSCVFIDSFDPESPNHSSSFQLLKELRIRDIPVHMPAHGWFEVQCTSQRLSLEQRFVGQPIAGRMDYPITLTHIDGAFIKKYAMTNIPYIKGGDHIFIVIAKIDKYTLITSDKTAISVSKQCGINVFKPEEFLEKLEASKYLHMI